MIGARVEIDREVTPEGRSPVWHLPNLAEPGEC